MTAVAMDGICITGPTGKRYATELYAKFYRTTGMAGTFMGTDRLLAESDTKLEVYCNGNLCNKPLIAFLGNDRLVKWDVQDSTDTYPSTIPSEQVLKLMPLTEGKNTIRIRHVETDTVVECNLWNWSYMDKIIVVDIDGTITRSDVRGYIETVYMQYYQYCHRGVVEFFHILCDKLKCKILFLTSRPIAHYEETKKLLNSLRHVDGGGQNLQTNPSLQMQLQMQLQNAWSNVTSNPSNSSISSNSTNRSIVPMASLASLPDGPVFANKDDIAKAAYNELVLRISEHYKTNSLYSITKVFRCAHADLSELPLPVPPMTVMTVGDSDSISDSDSGRGGPYVSINRSDSNINNKLLISSCGSNPFSISHGTSPGPTSTSELRSAYNLPFKVPFILGFGNRVADARAYCANGVDPSVVFLIDKASQMKVWSTCRLSRVMPKRRLSLVLEADRGAREPVRQQMYRGDADNSADEQENEGRTRGERTAVEKSVRQRQQQQQQQVVAEWEVFSGSDNEEEFETNAEAVAEGDAVAETGAFASLSVHDDNDTVDTSTVSTDIDSHDRPTNISTPISTTTTTTASASTSGFTTDVSTAAQTEMLGVYMAAINTNVGVGRGEGRGLRTRHGPKVRFSSYTDPLLLQYCLEQIKLLGARDVARDRNMEGRSAAGSGKNSSNNNSSSSSGGRRSMTTLPLYSSLVAPHVIPQDRLNTPKQQQLLQQHGSSSSSSISDAIGGTSGVIRRPVDSDDDSDCHSDSDSGEDGESLTGYMKSTLAPCIAGFCAPGVMAAFTETSPPFSNHMYSNNNSNNSNSSKSNSIDVGLGMSRGDVCSEGINAMPVDCNST